MCEAAIRPNRIPENAFIAAVARLKCLWFSSGAGFSRLSIFPEEGEPAISGRIEPSKPALGEAFWSRNCQGRNQKRKFGSRAVFESWTQNVSYEHEHEHDR